MDVDPKARPKLMGFAIKRVEEGGDDSGYLPNSLLFKANDEGVDSDHSKLSESLLLSGSWGGR